MLIIILIHSDTNEQLRISIVSMTWHCRRIKMSLYALENDERECETKLIYFNKLNCREVAELLALNSVTSLMCNNVRIFTYSKLIRFL